ncbi:MAG: DamX protein [Gammaproteobacteria bacterium]|jgi:DamX protein
MSANSNSTSVRPASTGSIDPFVHGRDAKYYFPNSALRQRIELVRHLVEFGRQIVVLTGPSGAGKSAMLEQVVAADYRNLRLLQFVAGPTLNPGTLLKKISDELGINDTQPSATPIAAIRKSVTAAAARGELILLTIDDAHNLPTDVPGILAELAHSTDEAAELKIILTANPAASPLIDLLQAETRQQMLVHVVDVPRFGSEEITDLIKHRWNVANGTDEIPLTSAEFAQIYQQSNGVPGKAIVLARQIQILNANTERKNHDPALRYLVIGGALIAVFLLFAFFNADKPTKNQETQIDLELPGIDPIAGRIPGTAENAPKNRIALAMPKAAQSRKPEQEVALASSPTITDKAELSVKASTIEPPLIELQAEPLGKIMEERLRDPAPLPTQGVARAIVETAVPVFTPSVAPAITEEAAPERAPLPNPSLAPTTTSAASLESKAPVKTKITQEYSIEWLRNRPKTGYVLQLFGVRDQAAAKAFIKIRSIGNKSAVLVTELSGQPWYAVVYNYYPDRDAALRAIANLPPNLASTKPWARPILGLQ